MFWSGSRRRRFDRRRGRNWNSDGGVCFRRRRAYRPAMQDAAWAVMMTAMRSGRPPNVDWRVWSRADYVEIDSRESWRARESKLQKQQSDDDRRQQPRKAAPPLEKWIHRRRLWFQDARLETDTKAVKQAAIEPICGETPRRICVMRAKRRPLVKKPALRRAGRVARLQAARPGRP